MVSVNRVMLGGYLTADPQSRAVGNGNVCHFTIGLNRKWTSREGEAKEEATFVDCEAWAKVGEVAQTYLKKGRPVLVEGRLKLDRWKTDGGENRSKLKVNVETIQFLDQPGGSEGEAQQTAQTVAAEAPAAGAPTYEPEPF